LRLQEAAGRKVQLVPASAALDSVVLMADIIEDGRIVVDRTGVWVRWREREATLRAEADRVSVIAEARARAVFAYYARMRR
jgi:hypothetical protein